MRLRQAMFAIAMVFTAARAFANPDVLVGGEVDPWNKKDGFDFHGYFRESVGFNSKGGGQACFGLPGADFKARLGNECDHYFEATFAEQQTVGSTTWRWEIMPAYGGQNFTGGGAYGAGMTQNGTEPAAVPVYIQQNWGSLNFHDAGDLKLWVGDRYTHRENIDPFDWFFLNPFQGHDAVGVEDINLGGYGKAAFTIARMDANFAATQLGTYMRAEARAYGVPVNPNGSIEVDLQADVPVKQSSVTGSFDTGFMITAEHNQSNFLGGGNALLFQYGSATAMNNGTTGPTSDSKEWRIIENLNFAFLPQISGGLFIVYQNKSYPVKAVNTAGGTADGASIISAAIRPAYHVSDNFKLAVDVFYQSESFKDATAGVGTPNLLKVAFVPTFTLGAHDLYTRPELRFFVTYGSWNTAASQTTLGGPGGGTGAATSLGQGAFGTDTSGASFGAQYEIWF